MFCSQRNERNMRKAHGKHKMMLRFPGLNFPARQYLVFTIFTTSRPHFRTQTSGAGFRPFRPATSTYFYSLGKEIGRCTTSNVLVMLSLSRRAVKPVLKGGIKDVTTYYMLSNKRHEWNKRHGYYITLHKGFNT